MLPVNEVYGSWPLSGEIDIVESRGNGLQYTARSMFLPILTSPIHSFYRFFQRFKLCSRFTQLGTYYLPKWCLEFLQLVDRTSQVIWQQLPHVRIGVDR